MLATSSMKATGIVHKEVKDGIKLILTIREVTLEHLAISISPPCGILSMANDKTLESFNAK